MSDIRLTVRDEAPVVGLSVVTGTQVTIKVGNNQGTPLPVYDGATSITPNETEQILPTKNHTLKENITVGPIPNNYGKIIYNGSYIRVE